MWEVIPDKTKEHWLEVKDPEGWWSAVVKKDGCVHLNRYYGSPMSDQNENETDYIHICDIDDAIERLKALKQMALAHFGEWPG